MSNWIIESKNHPVASSLLVSLVMTLCVFHEYFLYDRTLITDQDVGMQYAYRLSAAKAIQASTELPLWNPLTFTGTSWIGQDPWANVLHTFQLFFLVIKEPVHAYMLGLIVIFLLAGFGAFYLFRSIVRLSLTASIIATGVYLFNYDIHEHIAMLFSAGAFVGLPFMVILADRYSRTLDLQYPLLAAGVAALCYLSSNALCLDILILFFIVFVGILTYQQHGQAPKGIWLACILVVIVSLLLSSLVIWPGIDNRFQTIRNHLAETTSQWWLLIRAFWGQALGLFDMLSIHHDLWHFQPSPLYHKFVFGEWLTYLDPFFRQVGAYGYISVLLLPATIWAVFNRHSKWVAFCGLNVLILAAVCVIQGMPVIKHVFYFATGGHSLWRPGNAILLLCSAGLLGLFFDGFNEWISDTSDRIRSIIGAGSLGLVILYTAIFVAYIGLVLAIQFKSLENGINDPDKYKASVISSIEMIDQQFSLSPSFKERAIQVPAEKFSLLLLFYSLTSIPLMFARYLSRVTLIAWFYHAVTMRKSMTIAVRWIFALLILLDCFVNQQAMGGFTDRVYYVFNSESIESKFLDSLSLANRTATVHVLIQDQQTFRIISDTQRSRPLERQFGSYGFYPLIMNYQMVHLVPSYSTYMSVVPPAIATFHRTISAGQPNFPLFLRQQGRLDSAFFLLNPAHDLVNELAIEYFFVPLGHELNQDGTLLVEKGDDYAIYKNLKAKPRIELQSDHDAERMGGRLKGKIIGAEFDFNRVLVEVEIDRPAHLILRDTYDPHWVCDIDGLPVTVSPYKDLFRQVNVGPGHHQIRFRYSNSAFHYGSIVSGLTLVSTIMGILAIRYRQSRIVMRRAQAYREGVSSPVKETPAKENFRR